MLPGDERAEVHAPFPVLRPLAVDAAAAVEPDAGPGRPQRRAIEGVPRVLEVNLVFVDLDRAGEARAVGPDRHVPAAERGGEGESQSASQPREKECACVCAERGRVRERERE